MRRCFVVTPLFAILVLPLQAAEPPIPPVPAEAGNHWCGTGTDPADEAKAEAFDTWARSRASHTHDRAGTLSTTEGIRQVNGVYIVTSDDVTAPFDNPVDLGQSTLTFTPSSSGFVGSRGPLAADSDIGLLLRTFDQWGFERYNASFAFPLGPASYKTLYIAANGAIFFVDPTKDVLNQLGPLEAATRRQPLVAPMLTSSKSYGAFGRRYKVYVKETADALTVTWKSLYPSSWDEQFQAVLSRNGEVRISYMSVPVDSWGLVMLTTGSEPFYEQREPLLGATDPANDTTTDAKKLGTAIEGALDLVNVSIARLGGSDLIEVRIKTRVPIDRTLLTGGAKLTYVVNIGSSSFLRADIDSQHLTAFIPSWSPGADPSCLRIEGDTVSIAVLESLLVSADGAAVNAYSNYTADTTLFADAVSPGKLPHSSPAVQTMSDLAAIGGSTVFGGRPILEAFTLPVVNVSGVWQRVKTASSMTDEDADEVAIYQTFRTDLVLYAGGYSTVGNPQVDGVRPPLGSAYGTGALRRPALLHLDQLGTGWNSSNTGILSVLTHEFGHRWLYFLRIREGSSDTSALNPDGSHPKVGVQMRAAFNVITATDTSAMGGGYFTAIGPNVYQTQPRPTYYGYTWHELYLMGLASAAEVTEPWFYLSGDGMDAPYWPGENRTYTVTKTTPVAFQQILTAMGPRKPAYGVSSTEFPMAWVIMERPSRPISDAQIADFTARHINAFARHFAAVTNNRGHIVEAKAVSGRRRRAVKR